MTVSAVIVAGGQGQRAGGSLPKQYQTLLGRPVLAWSVAAFEAAGVDQIIVVRAAEHAALADAALGSANVAFANGGESRTASVRAGLAMVAPAATVVLVHDAARPGLTPAVIRTLVDAVNGGKLAAAPVLKAPDTLLRTDGANQHEVDRQSVVRVQTPQAFRADALLAAYAALKPEAQFNDDLGVMRATGVNATLVDGDERLMKITHPHDAAVLEKLMSADRIIAVGNGVDAHRFGTGEFVTLCGVEIPHDKGLLGHSDADAGWHALVDAILGALGEGDIGAHFPPSDPQWKGANSERFLRHAAHLAQQAGARILHVDITLICERPKIGPHREAMRVRTAEVLGLPLSRVSVKATTTERMGFLGREEGLAAQATATLDRAL